MGRGVRHGWTKHENTSGLLLPQTGLICYEDTLLTVKDCITIDVWCLCQFPTVAITITEKVSCLKQHLIRILQFCRSEVQYGSQWAKIMLLAGLHYFMDIPRENPFSFLFQLHEAARFSLWPCSSIFKGYCIASVTISPWSSPPLTTAGKGSLILTTYVIWLGPRGYLKIFNLNTSEKSLFSYTVTYA